MTADNTANQRRYGSWPGEVPDQIEVDDGLIRDVTEVLTSLRARLYGRRAAANRAARAIEALGQDGPA